MPFSGKEAEHLLYGPPAHEQVQRLVHPPSHQQLHKTTAGWHTTTRNNMGKLLNGWLESMDTRQYIDQIPVVHADLGYRGELVKTELGTRLVQSGVFA